LAALIYDFLQHSPTYAYFKRYASCNMVAVNRFPFPKLMRCVHHSEINTSSVQTESRLFYREYLHNLTNLGHHK
jgi:hypothetical protein